MNDFLGFSRTLSVSFLLLNLAVGASAWLDDEAGSSTLKFLKVPVSPREAALAGSGSATPAGGESGHNPLAAAQALNTPSLSFYEVRFPTVVGASLSELRFAHGWGAIAVHGGGRVLLYKDLEGRDADGFSTGAYGASAWTLDAGAAGRIKAFTWGLTGRYARQTIERWHADAVLADAALGYTFLPYLRVAVRVANAGYTGSYDQRPESAPLSLQSGLSLDLPLPGPVTWTTHADVRRRSDEDVAYLLGLEGTWRRILALRLGVPVDGRGGLSAGMGLDAGIIQLDYAFAAGPDLGGRHHFGIGLAL